MRLVRGGKMVVKVNDIIRETIMLELWTDSYKNCFTG
jgi:hypothetical protein